LKHKLIRHGDVDLRIIKSIPKSAKTIQNKTIMYGEATGHHHTFKGQVLVYEPQEPQFLEINGEQHQIQKYVEVQETAQLTHQEHKTLEIPKGVYAVLQEQEFDPLEQQIMRVRD